MISSNHINDIVISGIAGRFPQCQNMDEFANKLLSNRDMISENTRWPNKIGLVPSRMGILNNLEKFDNDYFEINDKTADLMDPSTRILLELAVEAIIDAGQLLRFIIINLTFTTLLRQNTRFNGRQ